MWRQITQTFRNSIDFSAADVGLAALIVAGLATGLYLIGVVLWG